ncbi:MAG: AIR synthase related protein [Planctomycetota bacterium]
MRENALLQHVYAGNAELTRRFPGVTIPPGDDMGAIEVAAGALLVAVDQLADGVHVDTATAPLDLVGRKAITRNLSDVAAMAAEPVAAVVAATLPRGFGEDRAAALFDAMRTTAEGFGCPLVGGDIGVWDHPLLVSVTVLARPFPGAGVPPVTRDGSLPGDAIYVTGHLGGSLPTGHHLTFTPRLDAARALVTDPKTRPRAMVDLSDGIAQDLPRLMDHAELDAAALPIREGTPDTPPLPAWRHALADGEDYELLFTAPPDAPIPAALLDGSLPVTRIGTVADAGGHVVVAPDGNRVGLKTLDAAGWEHTA